MRQPPEFFDDKEIALIHIAGTLRGALALERLLTDTGVDYAVETDEYTGGLLFWTKRTGAFFYVDARDAGSARDLLERHRFKVHRE
jgi:hypothetical protein